MRDSAYNEFLRDPIYYKLVENIEKLGDRIFDVNRLVNLRAYMEGFTFYTSGRYRSVPVDILPRLLSSDLFSSLSKYLTARSYVLNRFIREVYEERSIPIPDWIVKTNFHFRPEMMGFSPPKGIYTHVYGADIVRVNGMLHILEDNLRIPSGIGYSYAVFEQVYNSAPELRDGYDVIEPTGLEYLYEILRYVSGSKDPVIAILSDGNYNSAYFEHKFISDRLGIILVEPSDIKVEGSEVVVKTLDQGEVHVDVIYRRIDDLDFITPGLMRAYLRGSVVIANAPGTGIADDKASFVWVPYLAQRYGIKLEGVVQPLTLCLYERENLEKVINSPRGYVIKKREGYGGIGLIIVKDDDVSVMKEMLKEYEHFIAQEILEFDTVTSVVQDYLYETYADFRFFVYYDKVATAVLSRVATLGSRVTNNSSGGMVKPVWITR
ncbi:circularly permuted type 2 ATP-grasp protein [Metallosphaera hakonensis JCM 8857 = DSM 7519]|uniref:Circularly permuted ATP-grasp type 2 domain-containing protein n=2 Tax=Metallosphaera hakonensis TaxID=79601 RepID=A0A2U9IXL5_9CREN|nr:circularly permuted type 2 ATP-grasp protein [Metallosphaera hakonensis JCM 8857 = DSM 7519]